MSKNLHQLPDQLVQEWPEVFDGLYINIMPVYYLNSISLEFGTGMMWQIDISPEIDFVDPDIMSNVINDVLEECGEELEYIHYNFNIEKFKDDIVSLTNSFLDDV